MNRINNSLLTASALIISLNVFSQSLKPIEIGEKVPDLSFKNVYNYQNKELSFSDFDGKNIILDFWASWCGPCIEHIPILDSIQDRSRDELQVIAVTGEADFVAKKTFDQIEKTYNIKLGPSIYTDTVLRYLFPNRIIPHYVWIGKDRKVKAITDSYQLTEKNIADFLAGKELAMPVKKDDMSEGYDYEIPLVKSRQLDYGGQKFYSNRALRYESILLPAFRGRGSEVSARGNYVTGVNTPIIILYKYAHSILYPEIGWAFWENDRFVLEHFNDKDSLAFGFRTHKTEPVWLQDELGKCFTYEIVFPDSATDERRATCMIRDLNRRFLQMKGFEVKSESRLFKYLALKQLNAEDRAATKGGSPYAGVKNDSIVVKNTWIGKFIEILQPYCYTDGINLPVLNKTGKKQNYIDVAISIKNPDLNAINLELCKYNLVLVEEKEENRMMIVVSKKTGKASKR